MMRWIAVGVAWALVLAVLAGVTYLIGRSVRRSDDPARLLFKWIMTVVVVTGAAVFIFGFVGYNRVGAFVAPITCVAVGVVLSIFWAPSVATWLFSPLTSSFDGGTEDWDPGPLYAAAMGRRKRGQYQEAIAAVQKQLAKYPNDLPGQMLLAEIYAEDVGDLAAATATVEHLCRQPGHTPKNMAFAMNQLADWQMKRGGDPAAARATLQTIVDWLPGTEYALEASQRLAHVAGDETLERLRDRSPVVVRPGIKNVGLLKEMPVLQQGQETPEQLAARYVDHLEAHPLDQEVREKLGALYADHYHRLDLAVDQLEQLIALPNQAPRAVARYLEEIADWQIRFAEDGPAAQAALQRIIDLYPGSALAERAGQRISVLNLELKGRKPSPDAVKMGVYEQNLGLKGKAPPPTTP